MKKLLSLFIILAVSATFASAKTKSLRIYLVPWDTEFVIAATADMVRGTASIKTTITDAWYADAFITWLRVDKMKSDPKSKVADIRLVIDAEQEDGSIQSYYASRFAICEVRSGKVRPIDASFRRQFSFFYEKIGG